MNGLRRNSLRMLIGLVLAVAFPLLGAVGGAVLGAAVKIRLSEGASAGGENDAFSVNE